MNQDQTPSPDQPALERQQAHFEKARKRVLKFLCDQGGKLNMGELHDHSMNRYLIQHQGFSRMMETFVNEGLVEYDQLTQDTTITEAGRKFILG